MKVEPNQMKRKAEKSFEFLFVLSSTVVSYSTLVQELMAALIRLVPNMFHMGNR